MKRTHVASMGVMEGEGSGRVESGERRSEESGCCRGSAEACAGGVFALDLTAEGNAALTKALGVRVAQCPPPERLYLRGATNCHENSIVRLVGVREPVPDIGETVVVHVYQLRSVLTLSREVPTARAEVPVVQNPSPGEAPPSPLRGEGARVRTDH